MSDVVNDKQWLSMHTAMHGFYWNCHRISHDELTIRCLYLPSKLEQIDEFLSLSGFKPLYVRLATRLYQKIQQLLIISVQLPDRDGDRSKGEQSIKQQYTTAHNRTSMEQHHPNSRSVSCKGSHIVTWNRKCLSWDLLIRDEDTCLRYHSQAYFDHIWSLKLYRAPYCLQRLTSKATWITILSSIVHVAKFVSLIVERKPSRDQITRSVQPNVVKFQIRRPMSNRRLRVIGSLILH